MGEYKTNGQELLHVEQDPATMLTKWTHIADCRDNEAAHFAAKAMNTYDDFDYMAEADRTNSTIFRPDQVAMSDLRFILQSASKFAEDMNLIKKLLFRGKTRSDLGFIGIEAGETTLDDRQDFTADQINILHGAVGVITEAGEVADFLLNWLKPGGKLDSVNVVEECGDLRWYIARMLRGVGITDRQCEVMNIDKLHGRHGETFNAIRDANRNLETEHAKLEDSFNGFNQDVDVIKNPVIEAQRNGDDLPTNPEGFDLSPLKPVEHHSRTPIGGCEGLDC